MKALRFAVLASILGLCMVSPAYATLVGPLGGSGLSGEYASSSDSPFNGLSFSYFYLEDFEDRILNADGSLNVPGVIASGNGLRIDSGQNVDSVDLDDGSLNGNGSGGSDMWAWGIPGITFSFDNSVLGHFPTHVGIVWTDGVDPITFEAYDASGSSLGTLVGNHADLVFSGTTAEDRFYGVMNDTGISKIVIYNGTFAGQAGIEVDHLQYGYSITPVPEPTPTAVILSGICLLFLAHNYLKRHGSGRRVDSTAPEPTGSLLRLT